MMDQWAEVNSMAWVLLFLSLSLLVPSMPPAVTANSSSSTVVLVTWMEPAVFYRECIHNCMSFITLTLFTAVNKLGVGGIDKYTSVFLEKMLRYYYIPTIEVADSQ